MNGKFTHARYVNSKKQEVEAIWYDEEQGTYTQEAVRCDLENSRYLKLLDTFTTDEISTMTDQHSKNQAENFKLFVKSMASDYGLVYDPNAADPTEKVHGIDHIFNPPEGDEGTDLMFELKLKIFDMPEVQKSKNKKLKEDLRKAETPLEALFIAGKFLFK
jgi:hypothetical protein